MRRLEVRNIQFAPGNAHPVKVGDRRIDPPGRLAFEGDHRQRVVVPRADVGKQRIPELEGFRHAGRIVSHLTIGMTGHAVFVVGAGNRIGDRSAIEHADAIALPVQMPGRRQAVDPCSHDDDIGAHVKPAFHSRSIIAAEARVTPPAAAASLSSRPSLPLVRRTAKDCISKCRQRSKSPPSRDRAWHGPWRATGRSRRMTWCRG